MGFRDQDTDVTSCETELHSNPVLQVVAADLTQACGSTDFSGLGRLPPVSPSQHSALQT